MLRSVRCAVGAALLAVVAIPVAAGATEESEVPVSDVAPVVTDVTVAPSSTVEPTTTVADDVTVAEPDTPDTADPSPPEPEPSGADVPSPAESTVPEVTSSTGSTLDTRPEPETEGMLTFAQQTCSPEYSGACVPIDRGDVNCGDIDAGPFQSIGTDPFGLDSDGDGEACESNSGPPVTPDTSVPPTTAAPGTPVPVVEQLAAECHPSYDGVCVPAGGDVDCAQLGATDVRVVGPDEFRLDSDGDGVGCESDRQITEVRAAAVSRTSSQLAATGSSSGIAELGVGLLLAGLTFALGSVLVSNVGPWRTRGGFTVVRYDRYGRERRTRVVTDCV